MDVVSAYLAGELQEEVFMEIPEGLDAQDHVCRLRKGIYGLKQSVAVWHDQISKELQ